jgi:hypothetical protein
MVDETGGWADGSDDRAAEGLAHLQTAARELIAAARAILDVAEDLVDDPKTVTVVTDAVGGVVRAAAQAGRRAVGVAPGSPAPDGGAEPAGVERIRVD